MAKQNLILANVDDVTEKVANVFLFDPEEHTEKLPKMRRVLPPATHPLQKMGISEQKVVKKTEKGLTHQGEYESLLDEIKQPYLPITPDQEGSITNVNESKLARKKQFTLVKDRIKNLFGLVKLPHAIFALPFALTSLVVATNGKPGLTKVLLIILAMVTARNAAMTFNRIADRHIDQKNPRTREREIPAGQVSVSSAYFFALINMVLFMGFSLALNKIAFVLSPIALLVLLGYSLTKRFTHYTQFYLGLSLGMAPVAAWIAATGTVSVFSLILGMAVLFWVAGFDMIYALLDYDFDKQHKVKSLAVKFGVVRTLRLSSLTHVLAVVLFVLAGVVAGLGWWYFLGCVITSGLLIYEHRIVSPKDLSRVNTAFFTLNGYVSLIFFACVLLGVYL